MVMALNFEKFASQGNDYLNRLAKELKIPDNNEKVGRILKAVLHAIRNHLVPEESIQLIAQFPMFLKAVYVDGWSLSKKHKRTKHINDFIEEVRQEDGTTENKDFETDDDVLRAIKAVFITLRKYVSEGEMEDIAAELPKDLKKLVRERVIVEQTNKATSI